MKKRTLIFLLIAICCSFVSNAVFAQETRTLSMGGIGLYLDDVSNIHQFPGTMTRYPRLAVIEMPVAKQTSSYNIGLHYSFQKTVLGVYFNRPVDVSLLGFSSLPGNLTLERQTELFCVMESENYRSGLGLTIATDSFNEEEEDFEYNQSALDIGVKLGYSTASLDMGAHFNLIKTSIKEKEDTAKDEDKWGGHRVRVITRWKKNLSENAFIRPLLIVDWQKTAFDQDNELLYHSDKDYNELKIGTGLGFNVQIDDRNLVVLALEVFGLNRSKIDFVDDDYTFTRTQITLPSLFLGAESHLTAWLTGRFGANQIYGRIKEEHKDDMGTESITSHINNFNLVYGLGVNFKNFAVDANFNEGLLFSGPYFISGANEDIASRLSLTYTF